MHSEKKSCDDTYAKDCRIRPFDSMIRRRSIHLLRFSALESLVHAGILLSCILLLIRSVGQKGGRRVEEERERKKEKKKKKKEERSRVSHLNARLEIIPLGHFLVLRRGNFSPSAQLLLGVVQVKDRHRVQPALEHQARQVLNVVLPKGEKYPEILVRPRDSRFTSTRSFL